MSERPSILVLCTGNSARSQMAEGLLRHRLGDAADVQSAGTAPADAVHPLAIAAMAELGIDITAQRPKALDEVMRRSRVDTVITVCGDAAESCPVWPERVEHEHWPLPDPAKADGPLEERQAAFRWVRDDLTRRIDRWLTANGMGLTAPGSRPD